MKFIHYIEKVSGVEIMGMVSLIIFVFLFSVMLFLVFKADKKDLQEISQIPLDN